MTSYFPRECVFDPGPQGTNAPTSQGNQEADLVRRGKICSDLLLGISDDMP
jgi:hypothetical protein